MPLLWTGSYAEWPARPPEKTQNHDQFLSFSLPFLSQIVLGIEKHHNYSTYPSVLQSFFVVYSMPAPCSAKPRSKNYTKTAFGETLQRRFGLHVLTPYGRKPATSKKKYQVLFRQGKSGGNTVCISEHFDAVWAKTGAFYRTENRMSPYEGNGHKSLATSTSSRSAVSRKAVMAGITASR